MTDGNPAFKDKIGQDINIGAIVAYPRGRTSLEIGKVERITSKKVHVSPIGYPSRSLMYPNEVIVIDEIKQITLYLLMR